MCLTAEPSSPGAYGTWCEANLPGVDMLTWHCQESDSLSTSIYKHKTLPPGGTQDNCLQRIKSIVIHGNSVIVTNYTQIKKGVIK